MITASAKKLVHRVEEHCGECSIDDLHLYEIADVPCSPDDVPSPTEHMLRAVAMAVSSHQQQDMQLLLNAWDKFAYACSPECAQHYNQHRQKTGKCKLKRPEEYEELERMHWQNPELSNIKLIAIVPASFKTSYERMVKVWMPVIRKRRNGIVEAFKDLT
jgi:hypothetical protein